MKVSLHTYPKGWPWPSSWQRLYNDKHRFGAGKALAKGIAACGHQVVVGKYNQVADSDVSVMWSWKQPELINSNTDLLVLERGFIQPRNNWVSLSWNGFNGRGIFPGAVDNGERFNKYFLHHLKPWKKAKGKNALLIGQVPGDASLEGTDIIEWLEETTRTLIDLRYNVFFRPHPEATIQAPKGTQLLGGNLQYAFSKVDCVVTFCSTTAVEAILAGIPSIIMSDCSVASQMGSKLLDEPFRYPDRTQWCHDLAWRQWTLDELADGSAWRHAVRFLSVKR